jgi:hypothetical protein
MNATLIYWIKLSLDYLIYWMKMNLDDLLDYLNRILLKFR